MIHRSVKRTFRNVFWQRPASPVSEPAIFVANHHGWHDGYVMYLALLELHLMAFHDWIEEYDAFPLFGKVGGMPFPANDVAIRARTIRKTIRLMSQDRHSLMLFAEGKLHRPPELLVFGKSLALLHRQIPDAVIIPVGIRYEQSIHERPTAYLLFGPPMESGNDIGRRTRLRVASLLDQIAVNLAVDAPGFEILQAGTPDVNERMDMRKIPRLKRKSPGSNSRTE